MKRKYWIRLLAAILSVAILFCVCGCQTHKKDEASQQAEPIQSKNLMAEISPKEVNSASSSDLYAEEMTDFALRLLKECNEPDENTLLSPLSVVYALAMTANGAEGQTLAEIETVLGVSIEDLNPYLHGYLQSIDQENTSNLQLADSIWFTSDKRFSVKQDFLQCNADYYRAEIYETDFDSTTLQDINHWVSNNTDGLIPKILDQIPEQALMYLVNAVAFDAQWISPYETHQVSDGHFTLEDGTRQKTEFMSGTEHYYLSSENATGFLKYYEGHRYAFAALLPKEGLSLAEYVSTLNSAELHNLLSNPQYETVETTLPKFETEYETDLATQLSAMGMVSAFDPQAADFSGIGSSTAGNICISRVLHKTYLRVDESGTKAAASTVVEMTDAAAMVPNEIKTVHLNRPFCYMIIDTETNVPVFIGTLTSLS